MSHTESTSGAGLSVGSILEAGKKLISPQEKAESPTVIANVAETSGKIGTAVMSTLATAVDIPLGVGAALVSLPINVIGKASQIADATIARPIDWTRARIRNTIAHPFATIMGRHTTGETHHALSA